MKEQIDEMAKLACTCFDGNCKGCPFDFYPPCPPKASAKRLYNAGYRKQKDGEWKRIEVKGENYSQVYYQHKDCKVNETQIFPSPHHFCPNCGSKMKGE